MSNGHGGKRPNAGRKKGARNRRTEEQEQAVAETGMTPLEYLTSVYRDKKRDASDRIDAAKAAAPYVHPKLSSVDLRADVEARHSVSDEAISPEEWAKQYAE